MVEVKFTTLHTLLGFAFLIKNDFTFFYEGVCKTNDPRGKTNFDPGVMIGTDLLGNS